MSTFEFDVDSFLKSLDYSDERVRKGATRGMNDVTDELIRVSSEIAPHAKGTLEKSHSKEVGWNGNTIVGEVTYSVNEQDRKGDNFNYALWTHEETYKLGEKSENKPGTQGWSGKHYDVGRKYLERPLKGESDAYKKHLADEIRKELT